VVKLSETLQTTYKITRRHNPSTVTIKHLQLVLCVVSRINVTMSGLLSLQNLLTTQGQNIIEEHSITAGDRTS
jgi:hypothetical protein